ncbi:putative methyltransferase NSUN7 [Xyrauchen texanus]|uniref:putative methyltransferase NSUN7 n=1 Tax=Xyrauchen texanus TaxID=154827 RepID=UPI0022429BE9|nr:putative methyltransferase NSUN7 [Xyrauchen texanus]
MVRKSSSKLGSQISGIKHLSLLDPAPPEPAVHQTDPSEPGVTPDVIPDQVYLHAAMIFQYKHLEKPAAHRVISYGKRSEVSIPAARDEASQRLAYQLAFNTLKYQALLEDVLIDSCFGVSQPMAGDWMSLVAVMLTDLMDRKFLPRMQPVNQEEQEVVREVREVEACLLRRKTKLIASLARCRIKHDLLTIDNILPKNIQHKQERASHLPLYAWVNTLRTSLEEVIGVLHTSGFSCVKSVGQLEGRSFCKDPHCHDLLVFPNSVKTELTNTGLLTDYTLIIQDKSCCVGPWALRPLLSDGGDVLMAGCFSALTVAHVAAVTASAHTHTETHTLNTVFVCLEDRLLSQREELQKTLIKLGCQNVKLLSDSLHTLDVSDSRLQKVHVIVLMPVCSMSAVSNPVDYIMQENRDIELLLDLSQGAISPDKLQTLVCQQITDLERALLFPKVRSVLYSTCSMYSEENEKLLERVLSGSQENSSTAPPYRLTDPDLLQHSVNEDKEKDKFFKLEASDHNNGCFIALLTREPEPEVIETPQEVIARAAAKGLLDGILPNQPIKKEGRGRKSRRAPANHTLPVKPRPHNTQSNQSRVAEFLKREMRTSSSEVSVADKPARSRRPSVGVFSRAGSAPNPASSSSHKTRLIVGAVSTNGHRSPVSLTPPPAPPKVRQEVLQPTTLTFPPVLFHNNGVLPLWRSHAPPAVRPNPAHTYLPITSMPARPRSQTPFRVRFHPLRPWL